MLLHAEISEDEAEDRLQDAIQEKFAIFGDVRALVKISSVSHFGFDLSFFYFTKLDVIC